jgi:hypothetical protein
VCVCVCVLHGGFFSLTRKELWKEVLKNSRVGRHALPGTLMYEPIAGGR